MTKSTTLHADARNRAVRTFLQGLAFTVAAALVVSLLAAVTTATTWSEFGLTLVGFSFFQSIAVAALSWLMRAVLDPSRVPTPLPPANPGEPDDDSRSHFRVTHSTWPVHPKPANPSDHNA